MKRMARRYSTCTLQSAVIFLIILINLSVVTSLKCYKCTMTKPSPHINETVRLCSSFNYSSHFIVDCPYSTMCTKKDISVNLPTPINGTERDCAMQRYDYQDLEDGKWRLKFSIAEPYKEGCSVIDDKGLRSSRTEFCYCRGDLCNASSVDQPNVFIVLILLSIYRYILY